ncbi:MAG TPA: DUF2267 domain-containing protein [Ensifer sp.]|nr:DUF2267 domain-containing protein [Ensifer sp.]
MPDGHHSFDHALHEANLWLKATEQHLHCSEAEAHQALRAVLQALRDRLPAEFVPKLSAQLPLLVRGIYFEGWSGGTSNLGHRAEDFTNRVRAHLPPHHPLDGRSATIGVFEVLWERLDPGETAKIIDLLPAGFRDLWPRNAIRG